MGRADPPRHPAALGRPQRRRRPRRPARPALPGGRRPAARTRASGVLGHLDTAYGDAAFGELVSDAHRYLDWYQVDGFYLDRCPDRARRRCPRSAARSPRLRGAPRRTATSSSATAPTRTPAMPRPPTSWSPSPGPGPTTAGRRWPSGPPTTRRSASATSCTASRAATWTRRCASPAGRAPRRSTSPTARTRGGARPTPGRRMPGYWDEIVSRIGTGVSE